MQTREQVIEGLNGIHAVACGMGNDQCYLNSIGIKQLQTLINDATKLLMEQEPRVMTLEEVKALPDETDVWLEEFCTIVIAATISHNPTIIDIVEKGIMEPIEDRTFFYGVKADYNDGEFRNSDYGKEWRCWTSRPTDMQSAEVKWE